MFSGGWSRVNASRMSLALATVLLVSLMVIVVDQSTSSIVDQRQINENFQPRDGIQRRSVRGICLSLSFGLLPNGRFRPIKARS